MNLEECLLKARKGGSVRRTGWLKTQALTYRQDFLYQGHEMLAQIPATWLRRYDWQWYSDPVDFEEAIRMAKTGVTMISTDREHVMRLDVSGELEYRRASLWWRHVALAEIPSFVKLKWRQQ